MSTPPKQEGRPLAPTGAAARALGAAVRALPPPVRHWMHRRAYELPGVRTRRRLVPAAALQAKYEEALAWLVGHGGPDAVGDYLEFGVYNGTSLACMHRALDAAGLGQVRLFGFDSFEGLPATAGEHGGWRPGQLRISETETRRALDRHGVDWRRVTLVKGWFDDTATPATVEAHGIASAGVVMVDCDNYSSAKTALSFVEPLLGERAVVVFDDWHHAGLAERGLGEKRAFEEFLAEHPGFRAEPFGSYAPKAEVFALTRTV